MSNATNAPVTDDLLKKLKKILALAGDGNPNEHQRQVAMEKAQELLEKHNLSMADVNGIRDDLAATDEVWGKRLEPWHYAILNAVEKLYFIRWYRQPRAGGGYTARIIGTPENIEVARNMASWLMGHIGRQARFEFKTAPEQRSFKLGAAMQVARNAFEINRARRQQQPKQTGTALMVVRNQLEKANEDFLKQSGIKLKITAVRRSRVGRDAMERGKTFGNGINLSPQISGKKTAAIGG